MVVSTVELLRTSRIFIRMMVLPFPGLWWEISNTRHNLPSRMKVIPAFKSLTLIILLLLLSVEFEAKASIPSLL